MWVVIGNRSGRKYFKAFTYNQCENCVEEYERSHNETCFIVWMPSEHARWS